MIGDFITVTLIFPLTSRDNQFFHDATFMKIILNQPHTNCLCLIERALPTVHVFRRVPTGKHNCNPSSYFLSMIGAVYSQSLKKRSRVCLHLHYAGILQYIWKFCFFSPFFPSLVSVVWLVGLFCFFHIFFKKSFTFLVK